MQSIAPIVTTRALRDPRETLELADCRCHAAGCEWPCEHHEDGVCVRLQAHSVCGMQLPCCVGAADLATLRALGYSDRRAESGSAPMAAPCHGVLAHGAPGAPDVRLATYEVTNGEYRACVASRSCSAPEGDPTFPNHSDYAVVGTTRAQAVAYCTWLGSRLPTDAEWLAAACADGAPYPWGDAARIDGSNCYFGDRGHRVGRPGFAPDDVVRGIYDLHGNASEWTSDGARRGDPYCSALLGTSVEGNVPWHPLTGFRCVAAPAARGGG